MARGRQDLSKCHEGSATIAGETAYFVRHEQHRCSKSNLVYHETALDAPVKTLAEIDSSERAHGVRVNQRDSHFKNLHQLTRPSLKKRM